MIRRLLSSRRVVWPVATTVAVALWLVYSRPPSRIVNNNVAPSGGHVVRGAIHVHSQRSDGGGTLDDIAEEARVQARTGNPCKCPSAEKRICRAIAEDC